MKNRVPTYPGRVQLTPVAGTTDTFDMVRADVPIEEGMPLNMETLLQDSTGALLGLDSDATPDDALKAIINKLNGLITYGTADLTAGTSNLETGTIYLVYK